MKTHIVFLLATLALAACGDQTSSNTTVPTPDMDAGDVTSEGDTAPDDQDVEGPEDILEPEGDVPTPEDVGDDAEDEAPLGNQPPVARAGADLTWHTLADVALDGSESVDPEGGELTFSWTIRVEPEQAVVFITDADTPRPVLNLRSTLRTATVVATLIVVDPEGAADTDEITISPGAFPIVASFVALLTMDRAEAVVGDGDRIYVGTDDGLVVVDAEGDTLQQQHQIESRGGFDALALNGDHLLALGGFDTFAVFALGGDDAPTLLAELEVDHRGALAISGDTAYVLDLDLSIIDIEDPESPRLVTEIRLEDTYGSLSVSGDRLIATRSRAIDVYDISAPQSPTLVQTLPIRSSSSCEVALGGETLFVGCNGVNGSNTFYQLAEGRFVEGDQVNLGLEIGSADIRGDRAWILDGRLGLSFTRFDVQNPLVPAFLCTGMGLTQCDIIEAIDERRAVCIGNNGRLLTLLVAPDTSPRYQQVPAARDFGFSSGLFEAEGDLFYTSTGAGLELRRAGDISVSVGGWEAPQPTLDHRAVRDGDRVFFKNSPGSLTVLDTSDPSDPEALVSLDSPDLQAFIPLVAGNGRLVVGNGAQDASILDTSDMSILSSLDDTSRAISAALTSEHLALVTGFPTASLSLWRLEEDEAVKVGEVIADEALPFNQTRSVVIIEDKLVVFTVGVLLVFDMSQEQLALVRRLNHSSNSVGRPSRFDELVMALGGQISLTDFTDLRTPRGLVGNLISPVQHRTFYHEGAFLAFDPNPGAIVRTEIPQDTQVDRTYDRGRLGEPLIYTLSRVPEGVGVSCLSETGFCSVEGSVVTYTPNRAGTNELVIHVGERFWTKAVVTDRLLVE